MKDPIQKILVVNKPFKEMRDPEGYVLIGIADFLLRFISRFYENDEKIKYKQNYKRFIEKFVKIV